MSYFTVPSIVPGVHAILCFTRNVSQRAMCHGTTRKMLSDAAIVLAMCSLLRTKRVPWPISDLIVTNVGFDIQQPRFSAAYKRLAMYPFLSNSSNTSRGNKKIDTTTTTTNQMSSSSAQNQNISSHQPIMAHPGYHWNHSQVLNHLISLIKVLPIHPAIINPAMLPLLLLQTRNHIYS